MVELTQGKTYIKEIVQQVKILLLKKEKSRTACLNDLCRLKKSRR